MSNKNLSNHQFPLQLSKGGAVDIHKDSLVACILKAGEEAEFKQTSSLTKDLRELCQWFIDHSIEEVAIGSTGNYWHALYGVFTDAGLRVSLVNPALCKQIPGRKTDMNDAHWLCKLLVNGLLKKSFVAPQAQQELRDLTRRRQRYTQALTRYQNQMLKVLESSNIKIRSVLSSMSTQSAMNIVKALSQNQTDVTYLVGLLRGKAKAKAERLIDALEGRLTKHHQQMLCFYLQDHAHILHQLDTLDGRLAELLAGEKQQKIDQLEQIDGIGRHTAQVILAELGDDMSHFSSSGHVTAWGGLAPGNAESAGKRSPAGTRKGNPYLRVMMIQAAWAATRMKNSYWSAAYRNLSKRLPKKKAIVAIARKMLKVVYKVLKNGYAYQKWTMSDFYALQRDQRGLGNKTW